MLDPNDFVIVRRRKKYKFAKFANSPICFEIGEWKKRHVDYIEVGAGDGKFGIELARRHPDKIILAVDVKADRLQKGAYEAMSEGLKNIFFVRARADQLEELCELNSISKIWITFPDPFPKKRSAGRRLTHPNFLNIYRRLLAATGHIYLKHDNTNFFCWSLEQIVESKWKLVELSFNLHDSHLDDDTKIMTTYERRWLSEGLVTQYVCAQPQLL